LNVRFLNPMSPGAEVRLTGELSANRKGRLFETKAMAQDANGRTLAEATGKYLPIKTTDASTLVADFVGDAGWLLSANHSDQAVTESAD